MESGGDDGMIVEFGSSDWNEHWNMKVDLNCICESEGRKVWGIDDSGNMTGKKVIEYPVKKVRKLFTLMVKNIENEEKLDEIQQFLDKKSKKYAEIFKEIRKKRK